MIIAIALLNAWWFIALPLAIVGAWFFPYFAELIVAGVVYDALFGMIPGMGLWSYSGTIISVILFMIVFLLKKLVR